MRVSPRPRVPPARPGSSAPWSATVPLWPQTKEWLAGDDDQAAPASQQVDRADEEQILRCLGAAVIMRWNTLPKKIQRELFEHAGCIGDLQQTTELKGQIARFLHHHKDDGQKPAAPLP